MLYYISFTNSISILTKSVDRLFIDGNLTLELMSQVLICGN